MGGMKDTQPEGLREGGDGRNANVTVDGFNTGPLSHLSCYSPSSELTYLN